MQVCTAHGSVDAYLGMFQDVACYRDSPSFSAAGCSDAERAAMEQNRRLSSESQKKANDALFKGLEQQQRNLTADARQLERLQSAAQGATGQMQAIGFANQLAANQANQLLQIRGLLVAQQNAIALFNQVWGQKCQGKNLSYNPTGSGAGREQFVAKNVDFAGSDSALSEEEARKILQAAEGTCAYTPIALALYTGARLGEILALSWEDVDLAAGCIFIRQALKRSRTGELLIDAPKTRGSRRRVEIGPETAAVLKRQKKLQAEWRLKAGPLWQDTGLVCTREDGSPINPHAMSSLFHKVAAKAGVRAGFHSLRHTHATLLLKADVNLKIVQERLGHASISITGDLYSHVKPGMQKEAAALIEQALKK